MSAPWIPGREDHLDITVTAAGERWLDTERALWGVETWGDAAACALAVEVVAAIGGANRLDPAFVPGRITGKLFFQMRMARMSVRRRIAFAGRPTLRRRLAILGAPYGLSAACAAAALIERAAQESRS